MKSYIDITAKYLRVQKKRTILTAIGIILSVSLVTGIGTIFTSMYDANLRSTIRNHGDFHAAIPAASANQLKTISQNVETLNLGISQPLGYAAYAENEKNDIDPPYKYLNVMALDDNAITMLPNIKLKDGRLPAAKGEIVLDYWTLKFLPGVKIGDKVTLDLGYRTFPGDNTTKLEDESGANEIFTKTETRQFTLVGTLTPPYISDLNFARAVTYLDGKNLNPSDKYTGYIKLNSVGDAQKKIQNIAASAGLHTAKGEENEIVFNDSVLRLYAQSINEMFNSSFLTIILVVVSLVVLSTIAVIYNAFNISVVERVSQFGLLRCVGATPRQIRKIVFREAIILGVIGIPIGIVCGTLAMGVVFNVVSAIAPNVVIGQLNLVISPYLVIASVLIGSLTIYLSALLPARKAAKISPMEAVRGTGAFKKEKFSKTDKHRIVLKLLGAEGWMSWKNLGRNRKRFYITVLSMVISIVLFIVFSSLVGFAYQSGAVDTSDMPSYTIFPKRSTDKLELGGSGLADLTGAEGVDYLLAFSDEYAEVEIPADKLQPRAAEILKQSNDSVTTDKVLLYNSNMVSYQDSELETIMKKLNITSLDTDAFRRGEGVILINGGQLRDNTANKLVLTGMTTLQPGDSVSVNVFDPSGDEAKKIIRKLNVLAVVDHGLPGYSNNQNNGVYMIVSNKLFSDMAPWIKIPQRLMIMMKQGTDHTAVKGLVDDFINQNPNYYLRDMDDVAKSFKQEWVVLSIFLYGFVAVISLIGCLNIINTISTNIIIRTRELSVLRAIGMSDGSVRRMVAMESILHGAAAALVGSVIGTVLSWMLYNSMITVKEFPWTLPWQQILIAVAGAALVAVISGFVPLKRINKGIIMEGIRGEE